MHTGIPCRAHGQTQSTNATFSGEASNAFAKGPVLVGLPSGTDFFTTVKQAAPR